MRAVPPPLQDQGPPEDDLAANTPAADVDEGLSGAAVDGASEQGAEARPETDSDSAGDNDDGAASGAATPEQTGTPDEGPDHGTGPGDWGPGDYPDDPFAQEYLEMSGVAGQPGTRGYKVHVPPGYEATRPTPLLFAFHGLLQNAVMFAVNGTALMLNRLW